MNLYNFFNFTGLVAAVTAAPVYELFAVLLHRGPSASSGHYTAIIKDPVSGVTYKFNDTEVEKERKFSVAAEDDLGKVPCLHLDRQYLECQN